MHEVSCVDELTERKYDKLHRTNMHTQLQDNTRVHAHRHASTEMYGTALKPAVPLCLNYRLSAQI